MTVIIKGKDLSNQIAKRCIGISKLLSEQGRNVKLEVIRIGNDPSDTSYIKGIEAFADKVGVITSVVTLSKNVTHKTLLGEISRANEDNSLDGLLILKPLPSQIIDFAVESTISDYKDVDCISPTNQSMVMTGHFDEFVPNTAEAIIRLIEYNMLDLSGKRVAIINRSDVIGKPLSMMMLEKDATVTIAHSKTRNLKELTKSSDIVVTAIGKAKSLDKSYFHSKSVIIDAGMSLDEGGNFSGDVDFDSVNGYVGAITPVFGGVGTVTTAVMIERLLEVVVNDKW